MTGKELYELFETGTKIIVQLTSEIEILPTKEKGLFATIEDIKVNKDIAIININGNEFGNQVNLKIHLGLDYEIKEFEVISNTIFIKEYKYSASSLSYKDWLEEKALKKELNTLTLELETDTYKKLQEIAIENHTTIEIIINNLLELCVKEDGIVIWENGFDKPYKVLRTKEEVQEWIKNEN